MYNSILHSENCNSVFSILFLKISNSAAKDVKAIRPEKTGERKPNFVVQM